MTNRQVQLARIRYNTDSDGENLCWRLILDGQEMLVESVDIRAPVFTSRDWMEDIQRFKHHISVKNCCVSIDDDGEAMITPSE